MTTEQSKSAANARARTARTVVGIIGLVGLLGVVLTAASEEEFGIDTVLWALAFIAAALFWFRAGSFLDAPSEHGLRNLRSAGYSFVALWVLGAFATYFIWETLFLGTVVAIGVSVLGTFLVIQFINEGPGHIEASDS